jgi:hypothetical protein
MAAILVTLFIIGGLLVLLPDVLPLRGVNRMEVATRCEIAGGIVLAVALYLVLN